MVASLEPMVPVLAPTSCREQWRLWLSEARAQLGLMLPLATGQIINYALTFVTLHIVAGSGTSAVASVGLALALYTCLGRNLIMGLCGAVDTISSQAAGAGRKDLLGPIFRRSSCFLLLHLIPFSLLCISCLFWLPLVTDPAVGRATSKFLLLLIPDLATQCIWRPMNRVLASQQITCPFMIVSFLVLLCHYGFSVSLVPRFGPLGAAVATSCSGCMTLVFGALAVWCVGAGPTIWGGHCTPAAMKQAGAGWGSLASLAYPSAAMRMLESSGFSGIVTSSALLPSPKIEVDVMSLSLNVYGCFFTLFPAISVCADTRVGNAIGKGMPVEAKRAMRVAAMLTFPFTIAVSMVFAIPQCRMLLDQMVHVDALDPRVAQGLNTAYLIFVCGFYCIDGLQTALSGAIRGTGQQKTGARICVLAYWLLGIPAALTLGFACGLKSTGLWLGMLVGPMVQLILYTRLLQTMNWDEVAGGCEQRLRRDEEIEGD
ncbi:DTX6 [Symbiodinium natans]|uniref:DTX6 protein n=1 Tax=Symbiodinium natans TaxID=878477 RepID=A0A812M2Y5_9DINO|nr:DTX6 [Symbiodinium natans]